MEKVLMSITTLKVEYLSYFSTLESSMKEKSLKENGFYLIKPHMRAISNIINLMELVNTIIKGSWSFANGNKVHGHYD
jgi:hypothetical protein